MTKNKENNYKINNLYKKKMNIAKTQLNKS